MKTRIALIGCGYVADYYAGTLRTYPELEVAGVLDRDVERATRFSDSYKLKKFSSFDEVLRDRSIAIVLNLTNPASHYEVSRQCLEHGKHVYSEKPLATRFEQAQELVELARKRGLQISSAPCNALSETAQSIWKALRERRIGQPLLAYAELDDGYIAATRYRQWKSKSGTPWPWHDELSTGCTLEHAGYYLTWLAMFFGRAASVTAFSARCRSAQWKAQGVENPAPDFSVACIQYESGVVARLTCSILAPLDRTLTIMGEDGVLKVDECWDYRKPIYVERRGLISKIKKKYPAAAKVPMFGTEKLPLLPGSGRNDYRDTHRMDFARGVAELAEAIVAGRDSRLSANFCLHINEITLAIQDALDTGSSCRLRSTFEPPQPMKWAL